MIFSLAFVTYTYAYENRIRVGDALPRATLVKEGIHHYVTYIKDGDRYTPIDIMSRQIKFNQEKGKDEMIVLQRWDGIGDFAYTKQIESGFRSRNFEPTYHIRRTIRDKKETIEEYTFEPGVVIGLHTSTDHTKTTINVPTEEPTFNFETDVEMLQSLAFGLNYEVRINFYHPGGPSRPATYLFRVVSEERIPWVGGEIDCWVVSTDYNMPNKVAMFWFEKKSQLLVRKAEKISNGRWFVRAMID